MPAAAAASQAAESEKSADTRGGRGTGLTLRPEARARMEARMASGEESQYRMAPAVGMTQGGLSRLRRGDRGLRNLETAARIARHLGYERIGEAFDGPYQCVTVASILSGCEG